MRGSSLAAAILCAPYPLCAVDELPETMAVLVSLKPTVCGAQLGEIQSLHRR